MCGRRGARRRARATADQGAALDVIEEPLPLPTASLLRATENVLITPVCGMFAASEDPSRGPEQLVFSFADQAVDAERIVAMAPLANARLAAFGAARCS